MSSSQPEHADLVPSARTTSTDTQTQTEAVTDNPQLSSFVSPDYQSVYAQSTMTEKTSISRSSTLLAQLPLLSRSSRPSMGESSTSGSSATAHSRGSSTLSEKKKRGGNLLNAILFRKSKPENRNTTDSLAADSHKDHRARDWPKVGDDQPTSTQDRINSNNADEGPKRSKGVVRDPVKTVPSGKPPAVNFADLAYRYGSPSGPHSGSRRL